MKIDNLSKAKELIDELSEIDIAIKECKTPYNINHLEVNTHIAFRFKHGESYAIPLWGDYVLDIKAQILKHLEYQKRSIEEQISYL